MSNKASTKRHYQSAAEFDDVTLAKKREYWRTKKREQRARKSLAKKRIRNENLGTCKHAVSMSTVSYEHSSLIPKVASDRPVNNSDVSCKLEDVDTPINSSSLSLLVSESNINTLPYQKERWLQRPKLSNVLPQFQETSTKSQKGVTGNNKVVRSSVTGSSNTDATMVEHSESLCQTGYSGPTAFIELYPNSTLTQKTRTSPLNGNNLEMSRQSLVSMVLPEHNNQNKSQIKKCLPLRLLTTADYTVYKDQSYLGSKSPITKKNTCAFESEQNTTGARTTGTPKTEEEMAAKRREKWRIKKREQRAKHAVTLAMDREGRLGQPSCIGTVQASSLVNSKALRRINHNSAKPVSINQHSLGLKVLGSQASFAINSKRYNVQGTKPSLSSFSQQSSSANHTINKSSVHKRTPRRHHQMQMSLLDASIGENPEVRHAKQKEYWRIKKHEQRARLSAEVKVQFKDQDVLKRHVKLYQNTEICGDQAGCQKADRSTEKALTSASEIIGGFIKEEDTVTVSISKTTPKASLAASHGDSNVKCIGELKVQVQVSSPLYPDAPSVTKSPKLVAVWKKAASCSISSNFINAHKKSIKHKFSSTSQGKSKLAKGAVMGSMTLTIQSGSLTEEERVARMREYWRIKKREQRANRVARLTNGLLKSKVSVLKQRKSNQKSTKGYHLILPPHSISSSVDTRICDSSASAPFLTATRKQEHIYPSIQTVFSIPEITPCIIATNNKPSPCSPSESRIEPPAVADQNAFTLQAVSSMKKLLEESISTVEDSNATIVHVKCENEPLPCKTEDDLTSEDTETNVQSNVTIQPNVLLECDVSTDTILEKDIKLSPSIYHSPSKALSSEDTSQYNSHNLSQGAVDLTHALSLVERQHMCRDTQKHSDERRGPDQCCPSQSMEEQQLDENKELQRKREYWRLMKRQQRARKANRRQGSKDAVLHSMASQPEQVKGGRSQIQYSPSAASQSSTCHTIVSNNHDVNTAVTAPLNPILVSPNITNQHPSKEQRLLPVKDPQDQASQAHQEKPWQTQFSHTSSQTVMQDMSQDTATFRQILMQKKTKRCTKPAGPKTQLTDPFFGESKTKRSHIMATPNAQEESEEVIRRRRMHWRIKKQEQRARNAAHDRKFHQRVVNDWGPIPPQGHNNTSFCLEVLSIKSEDHLGYIAEPCQTGLKGRHVWSCKCLNQRSIIGIRGIKLCTRQ
ncbi:uncharacterized protein LOC127421828 isoform X2 [Myxocyprinus asiaticus]|uniref:uncharacterized protein LOC127421828 isoform X2 n=1 Tax=Myxocyprinus asiaticus TaxID=70543 RepID=UPI002223BC83|nr:uncharacterized protein LOC127421828 isoform X2 [Myxocyprinus asiaticus]